MLQDDGVRSASKHGWSRTAIWWLVPIAVLAAYWPCLPGEWIYDDWKNFDRNPPLRDGDWFVLLTRPYYGHDTTHWRPITSLLMAIGCLAGPFGVHTIAIVGHVLTADVLGSIARELLGDPQIALTVPAELSARTRWAGTAAGVRRGRGSAASRRAAIRDRMEPHAPDCGSE